jgi:hypothetical protein
MRRLSVTKKELYSKDRERGRALRIKTKGDSNAEKHGETEM